MHLQQSIQKVFVQLTATLELLEKEQYAYAGKTLSNASIGQHVRHIIEMFTCLEAGYHSGIINYENRKRDVAIETDQAIAIDRLKKICQHLDKENKTLVMEGRYDEASEAPVFFDTNYYREIAYNLEHAIHHMALIKVGIREVSAIDIPDSFGVAASTIKFRSSCAR